MKLLPLFASLLILSGCGTPIPHDPPQVTPAQEAPSCPMEKKLCEWGNNTMRLWQSNLWVKKGYFGHSVRLSITLDPLGRVSQRKITWSSGNKGLEEAALAAIDKSPVIDVSSLTPAEFDMVKKIELNVTP
ncbi:cell envelope integrity protein TolA [Aeromonas schubertii]